MLMIPANTKRHARPTALAPKIGMTITYSLLVIEELAALALPALMGWAIDRLVAGSMVGLIALGGAIAGLIGSGALRRLLDTRVFGGVQRDMSLAVARAPGEPEGDRRVGRLRLVGDYAQFFELHLPAAISAAIGSLGALVVLAIYDWRVSLAAAGCVAVLALLSSRFARRTRSLNRRINDRLEREQDVVLWGKASRVTRHFELLRRLRIRRSDVETGVFALNWLVLTALIIGALALIVGGGSTPGETFAQMTYVLAFVEGFSVLPPTIERFTQMRDVMRRMRGEGVTAA